MGHLSERYVWIRMGDVAEYEKYDSPFAAGEAVGNKLGRMKWEPMAFEIVASGIRIPPTYIGNNYISLFWGDKEAQWIKDLEHTEIMDFIRGVREGLE